MHAVRSATSVVGVRKINYMAKINHTFSMHEEPGLAQAKFARDIAPYLHRVGGFTLYRQEPALLAFSDGRVDPVAFGGRDGLDYSLLRRMLAHRITVKFEPKGSGTIVSVRGSAGRDVRDAISLLGGPKWS